ncbi:MAG: hypothetical protein DMG07_29300, partial [Acidobacteria bacterium]
VADTSNNRIRSFRLGGIIRTIAGSGSPTDPGSSGDGGPATLAKLESPRGVSVDGTGNVYIADTANHRIRRVAVNATINTVAGNGTRGFSGDGGLATSALLNQPDGVAVDASGNLYIVDGVNYRVRKVTPVGVISTVAGNGTSAFSGDGGGATSASLIRPTGAAVDSSGNLYVSDGPRIRRVTPGGVISTVAGNGNYSFGGDGGPATNASLNQPQGLAADSGGNLYLADFYNHRIRKIAPSGVITTVAGSGVTGSGGDGGQATSASLWFPSDVALDRSGNLYIADWGNCRIRKVTSDGVINTVAGNGGYGFSGDGGRATDAQLFFPFGVAVDASGSPESYCGYNQHGCRQRNRRFQRRRRPGDLGIALLARQSRRRCCRQPLYLRILQSPRSQNGSLSGIAVGDLDDHDEQEHLCRWRYDHGDRVRTQKRRQLDGGGAREDHDDDPDAGNSYGDRHNTYSPGQRERQPGPALAHDRDCQLAPERKLEFRRDVDQPDYRRGDQPGPQSIRRVVKFATEHSPDRLAGASGFTSWRAVVGRRFSGVRFSRRWSSIEYAACPSYRQTETPFRKALSDMLVLKPYRENPPYGILEGVMETSASFEAWSAPLPHSTARPGHRGGQTHRRRRAPARASVPVVPINHGVTVVVPRK